MGGQKSFKKSISEIVISDIDEEDINQYINLLKEKLVIDRFPIRIKLALTCEFKTPIAFDIIEVHYQHPTQVILTENNLSVFYDSLLDQFKAWVDSFQDRGSGHEFLRIISTTVKQYKYKYLLASSYFPLKFKSPNIINVQNKHDNKCFLWALLAKLYPASAHRERISKYARYEENPNMDGIEYPVKIKDIPKAEIQNNLCINVFALKDQNEKQSLYPIYISNYLRGDNIIIDLLYIENNGNTHYCLIKDLDSFCCKKDQNKKHICRNCLQGFKRKETLIKHQEICLDKKPCNLILPKKGKNILKFENHHFCSRLPVSIYCDFESFNIPVDNNEEETSDGSYTKKIFKQEINSYGIYVKSDFPNIYKSEYTSYVGEDAKEKYVKEVIKIYKKITYNMYLNEKERPQLNKGEEDEFQEATECYICKKVFEELTSCPDCKEEFLDEDSYCFNCEKQYKESHKIREHNHLTGQYRGAACQSCNSKEGKSSKLIPVFFHNGSNYDFHFIIEELKKYEDAYNKVNILSRNSEEYIAMEYGTKFSKLRFLDSYRFLTKGLSNIVDSLKEFPILEKEFETQEIDEESRKQSLKDFKKENKVEYKEMKKDKHFLLKQKGIYPYEYIDSLDKLKETQLPSMEKTKNKTINLDKNHKMYKFIEKWVNYRRVSPWFSTLKQTDITENECKHVINVWKTYKCKTIEDYHNLYLKTDVLLLADAFEKSRSFFLKNHQIDPCYCFSAPGLTWQCGLKYTGIELELLTDPDMLLMFEKGIRGGFSGVLGPRHVKAFNKHTSNYDKGNRIIDKNEALECLKILKEGGDLNDFLKEKFLLYLDANNLYGWAMSQKLPTGDFKWEEDPKYYKKIPKGRGCLVECDLEYTPGCKLKTNKFPLAPEHLSATEDMLSDYQINLLEKQNAKLGKENKLFLTLYDKKKYIIHNSILKDYIKLGMKVIKVHRTISFKESAWLKKYIDFNTKQRTKAKSLFEKDLWKLMNNAFYGKTMENIRNRSEIKLLSDEKEVLKYISKPNFKDSIIFNENLVAIINNVTSIKFNKPIYLGQAILDYSKQLMYNVYYNVIDTLWPDNEVVAMDTDSLFLSITSKDVYKDLEKIKEHLDTSDYPKEHKLYSEENKKIIGKFKDELNGEIMNEIIYIRSKAYSYKTNLEECKKLKGISRSVVEKEIKFNDYKKCLFNSEIQLNKMYRLNSSKHKMFINEVNKISINPFDDKRYISNNGINTSPYGLI